MTENKPILVGGVGEINFGKQYRQGNRIYDSENIAMCLMSQPVGNSGGYSYLYKVQNKLNNEGGNIMKKFLNNLTEYNFKMDTIKLFDSFAGIGALHQGLKELGVPIKIVGMSEVDIDAIISYAGIHIDNFKDLEFEYPLEYDMRELLMNRNIGWSFEKNKSSIPRLKKDKLYKVYKAAILLNNLGDISKLDYDNLPNFDLFNFSFCCQDISGAGKQKGLTNEDGTPTRSGLVKYGIEVIKAKKPKYIMIENVKALIQKKFIDDFNDIVNEIESYGYKCYYPKKDSGQPTCLNAKDYGIAQNRERIFVICVRNDIDDGLFSFPQGFDSGLRLKNFLEDIVDEKYYLDKPWHMSTELDEKHDTNEIAQIEGINYKATRSITDPELYCRTLDTMGGGQREPKVLDTNDIIKVGDIPKEVLNDNERQRRVYSDEGISPTILARTDNAKVLNNLDTNKLKFIGGINDKDWVGDGKALSRNYPQGNRVYDSEGIACSQTAQGGGIGSFTGLYKESDTNDLNNNIKVECNIYENNNPQAGRVYNINHISPSLNSAVKNNGQPIVIVNKPITQVYKIRKLTPKECWRLMGFRDECFDRAKELGISDSSLYKQAGNSIVVNCLYYIFKELFKKYIVK